MIRIDFLVLPEGDMIGFRITGHAGYAAAGEDIVCAAVSSAAYLVVNTITDVYHAEPLSLRADDGDMLMKLDERDIGICKDILTGLKLHFQQLEEQYVNEIRVGYMEV